MHPSFHFPSARFALGLLALVLLLPELACRGAALEPVPNASERTRTEGPDGEGAPALDWPAQRGASPDWPHARCAPSPDARERSCSLEGAGPALVVVGTVLGRGRVLERGRVRLDQGGNIECVGCGCSLEAARVVDCGESVVSPGLLNLHDHLGYAGTPPALDSGERYENRHQWRLGLDGHTPLAYSGRAEHAQVAAQELRMVMSGVTSELGAGGVRGLLRNLDDSELSELLSPRIVAETFPLADTSGSAPPSECAFGNGRDDAELVTRAPAYVPHLGEGIDARSRSELSCSESGDFALFSARTAVVHALALTAHEAEALARSGASVVWSPRSNIALYGNTTPLTLLRNLGVPVALGTDWLLTGSANLQRELSCARALSLERFHGELSALDRFRMVTSHAALALGLEDALGSLRAGHVGDLTVFARRPEQSPFEAVVDAEPAALELVLLAGRPLYGDAELVGALSQECEALEVCGAAKRACVTRETGLPLAQLEAAAQAIFPLFSCEADPKEPSCEARRDGEYGARNAADRDGDGVDDLNDLCPDVFDPIRPLDEAEQADSDADGLGDACDACPLDPSNRCTPPALADRDGDGILDEADDCPRDPDPEQADGDGDGRGDACDSCPAQNPGTVPCPLPIRALRDPSDPRRPADGSAVVIEGFVTGLRPDARGYYVEDDAAPYSAISVYGASSGLALGDHVRVTALTHRFAETDELISPWVELVPAPAGPPFSALIVDDPASVADGGALGVACEGLLVTLPRVTVVEGNPDAPNDYDETLLDGGLRLDDSLAPELDNTFEPGTELSLTGILGVSFGHRKLWPRTAAEVTALGK